MALSIPTLEALGHLIAQVKDEALPIEGLSTEQQVATSWIWFDEWEPHERQHVLDRIALLCTTSLPSIQTAPQDELAALFGAMQLGGSGPRGPAAGQAQRPEINFDQKLDYLLKWFEEWGPEHKWQFFSGLQAIDSALMAEFYNNLYDLQMGDDDEDLRRADRQSEWFPANQACQCCQGYIYGCKNMECLRRGACQCCTAVGGDQAPMVDVSNARDTWFPASRDCACCKGFVYKCRGNLCLEIGGCACRYASTSTT